MLNKVLEKVFSERSNWNKPIEIDGETYIYNSAKNEVRKLHAQGYYEIAEQVGFFTMGHLVMFEPLAKQYGRGV